MLGRHVYRVHPAEQSWSVTKEGESEPRADFGGRKEAVAEADQPSKVVVDGGDGAILEEHLFGSDLARELDTISR